MNDQEKQEIMQKMFENPVAATRKMVAEDFYQFLVYFWPEYASTNYIPNWHIKLICNELQEMAERVAAGLPKKHDLIINIPPGSSKTVCVSVMFPVWCWVKWFWMRFITVSYASFLSLESAEYSRDVVKSQRFKTLFPELEIKADKDLKSNYRIVKRENGKIQPGGNRFSTGIGRSTLTGFHGNILILDDPINPEQANVESLLNAANRWIGSTLSTRKVDKKVTPLILIQQRVHQNDPTGHILESRPKSIKHISLPGEIRNYESELRPKELKKYYSSEGLLDPKRMDWVVLENLKGELGQYGFSGQIGQKPVPPGGGMFKVDHIGYLEQMPNPSQIKRTIRFWDKAGTKGGGAYTVGVKMHQLYSFKWLVSGMKRGQWSTEERERIIKETAEADGESVEVWLEQEPGPIWEEELIQMANGERKKLKNINKGDQVINKDGKSTKVEINHDLGEIDSYKITTFSGREVYAGYNHPFMTPDGWIETQNLNKNDILAIRANNKIEPECIDKTIEEGRLAGYFAGDGCCTYCKKKGKLTNTTNANVVSKDELEGKDIIHCAESIGSKVHIGGSKGWTYYLSGTIRNWLKEVNLAGKDSTNKNVPEWVIKAPNNVVANFIGAFFACDGSANASTDHPFIDFYNTNLTLLKQIQSLLLRFGIYTMLRVRNYKPEFQKNRRITYRLVMRRSDGSMGRFKKYIPVYGVKGQRINEFKYKTFNRSYIEDPIVSIEKIGKLPNKCLTVTNGNSFLVNDIVVHNSGGKESAEATISNLAGFSAHVDAVKTDKAIRADTYSVQMNNGNILLLKGEWNHTFVEEHRFFPYSTHKDIVDASSGCWNHLVKEKEVIIW